VKLAFPNRLILLTLAVSLAGCGHKDDHDHEAHGHSHGDDAESFSGATHKEGAGITLLDETRQLLDLQTAEVQERALPRKIRFIARVFDMGKAADLLVLGTVSTNDAALLRPGLAVQFQSSSGMTLTGAVHQVSRLLANGEAEIIAAVSGAPNVDPAHFKHHQNPNTPSLKPGAFGEITITVAEEKPALVVPREAVIKSTTGNLVYAVNGDAYILTWVETGAESDGWVEIKDGLFEGDSVVVRGVMELWLVELRAVKGGQGCCPPPPKKGQD
jgi:multidrug efflux pump subunit AcrA (membrane-fusion protein)